MSRQEATDILMAEKEGGVFLVRDSATIQGDYVLCVRYDRITQVMQNFTIFPSSYSCISTFSGTL